MTTSYRASIASICVTSVIGLTITVGCNLYGQWAKTLGIVTSQPARAVLSATRVDLGSVPAGNALDAEFIVHNTGGRRLILRKKKSSCICMASREMEIIVPPGSRRVIPLSVDTAGLDGNFGFTTSYLTNDRRLPIIDLEVCVDVRPGDQRDATDSSP